MLSLENVMYFVDNFFKLPISEQAAIFDDMRRIENGMFSYRICMDYNDYTIEDIIGVIKGQYMCQHRSTHQKIVNIVKQTILVKVYNDCDDKWLIQDKVNTIYRHLSEIDLYNIVSQNKKLMQMILATEDVSFALKKFYCDRTVDIKNMYINNGQQIFIPNKVRWFKLYNSTDIEKLLNNENKIYLFLGENIDKFDKFIKYERNEFNFEMPKMQLSDGIDINKFRQIASIYNLNLN